MFYWCNKLLKGVIIQKIHVTNYNFIGQQLSGSLKIGWIFSYYYFVGNFLLKKKKIELYFTPLVYNSWVVNYINNKLIDKKYRILLQGYLL